MDSVVRQLLTRLSMYLQQELDFQVDIPQFFNDAEYSAQVLGLAEEIGHAELHSIATQIRKRQLLLFTLNNTVAKDAEDPQAPHPSTDPAGRDKHS